MEGEQDGGLVASLRCALPSTPRARATSPVHSTHSRKATERDPLCAPARALKIDILEGSDQAVRASPKSSKISRRIATGDAQGRALLLAASVWAARAHDSERAHGARPGRGVWCREGARRAPRSKSREPSFRRRLVRRRHARTHRVPRERAERRPTRRTRPPSFRCCGWRSRAFDSPRATRWARTRPTRMLRKLPRKAPGSCARSTCFSAGRRRSRGGKRRTHGHRGAHREHHRSGRCA